VHKDLLGGADRLPEYKPDLLRDDDERREQLRELWQRLPSRARLHEQRVLLPDGYAKCVRLRLHRFLREFPDGPPELWSVREELCIR